MLHNLVASSVIDNKIKALLQLNEKEQINTIGKLDLREVGQYIFVVKEYLIESRGQRKARKGLNNGLRRGSFQFYYLSGFDPSEQSLDLLAQNILSHVNLLSLLEQHQFNLQQQQEKLRQEERRRNFFVLCSLHDKLQFVVNKDLLPMQKVFAASKSIPSSTCKFVDSNNEAEIKQQHQQESEVKKECSLQESGVKKERALQESGLDDEELVLQENGAEEKESARAELEMDKELLKLKMSIGRDEFTKEVLYTHQTVIDELRESTIQNTTLVTTNATLQDAVNEQEKILAQEKKSHETVLAQQRQLSAEENKLHQNEFLQQQKIIHDQHAELLTLKSQSEKLQEEIANLKLHTKQALDTMRASQAKLASLGLTHDALSLEDVADQKTSVGVKKSIDAAAFGNVLAQYQTTSIKFSFDTTIKNLNKLKDTPAKSVISKEEVANAIGHSYRQLFFNPAKLPQKATAKENLICALGKLF